MSKDFFCEALKKARHERSMTQTQTAEKLNITQRAYSYYETGKAEPDMQTIVKIADLFQLTTDYLLGRYANTL